MTQLLLLRHAKSSWANPEIEDYERPLNKRGKRSAKALGAWFARQGIVPELAWCSPARRTRETWDGLRLECPVDFRPEIYEAETDTLLAAICDCPARSLLVIGHNPSLASLAHALAADIPGHPRWGDYPTGALTDLRFDADGFHKLEVGTGAVAAFLTPHDLTDD